MAESQNNEYKESWRDEYLKWICGFANAQGGKIYVGIDDSGNTMTECSVKMIELQSKIQSFDTKMLSANYRNRLLIFLDYLKTADLINGSTAKKLLDCSEPTARRTLAKAAELGLLFFVGTTNDKKYYI